MGKRSIPDDLGQKPDRGSRRTLFGLLAVSIGLTLALLLVFTFPILAGEGGPPDKLGEQWGPFQVPETDPASEAGSSAKQEFTREDKDGGFHTLLQGTISDGDVSFFIQPEGTSGNANFEMPLGRDHIFQTWWWFRIDGDTQETTMPAPDGETYAGNTAVFTWTDVLTRGFDAYMTVNVSDDGDGLGSLDFDLTITNTTGTTMTIDLFAYTDFDLAGSAFGDAADLIFANDQIQITDGNTIADFQGVGAQAYEVTTWPALRNLLNDNAVTNLTNTGLPFGPGDFTGAFQWSSSIPTGAAADYQELIFVEGPAIELIKTVGTDPGVCATTHTITVPIGTEVYYCYEVTNTGAVTLALHDLVDTQLGAIFTGFAFDLASGASVDTVAAGLTLSATITQTTVNLADWTAYNPGPIDFVNASASATVNTLQPLVLSKTIGLDPQFCAPTESISILTDTLVTYCYKATNTTLVYTYSTHDVVDSRLGTLLGPGFPFDLTPGATVFFTVATNITETTINQASWSAFGPNGSAFSLDKALVTLAPAISLTKTVGLDPSVCASTDTVNANSATPVYYCYEVTNTGWVTLPMHDLVDSELGSILSDFSFSLTPGASAFLTQTANVDQTTVNTATWAASLDQAAILDPMGDAFGFGLVLHDITTFTVSSDPVTLTMTVAFSDTITPTDSGQPTAVAGRLDIDSDENPLTGTDSLVEVFCPDRANIGTDYIVDLFSYSSISGQAFVIETETFGVIGFANVMFSTNSFNVEVPLATLGSDDGLVDVATIMGTIPEPTDCAPNGGSISNNPTSASASDFATVNSYPLYLPVVPKN